MKGVRIGLSVADVDGSGSSLFTTSNIFSLAIKLFNYFVITFFCIQGIVGVREDD